MKRVALFTRAWIEIPYTRRSKKSKRVALFTRAWIEIPLNLAINTAGTASPSSRGRGLKCNCQFAVIVIIHVALFTRAWIEIKTYKKHYLRWGVALFTRAWIEM